MASLEYEENDPSRTTFGLGLCDVCDDLDFDNFEMGVGPDPMRCKNVDLQEIYSSAAQGCEMCALLFEGISTSVSYEEIGHAAEVRITLRQEYSLLVELFWTLEDLPRSVKLEFYTRRNQPAAWPVFGFARDVPAQLDLTSCMDFLQKHLKDCDEDYVCRQERQTWPPNMPPLLPTRVLEVKQLGKGLEVRLLVPRSGQRAEYITLSHCWGTSKNMLMTTTSNETQHRQVIEWKSLPKTFQDALAITEALKISYIWIDSLCIIQDDLRDWESEAAKMGDVYARSYLTIAATGSVDCDRGLLNTRGRLLDGRARLSVPHKITEIFHPFTNAETKIFVRHSLSAGPRQLSSIGISTAKSILAPLLSRAWCLQERLLSPRLIHFHGEEMIFECKTMNRCECTNLDFEHNRSVALYGSGPRDTLKFRFNKMSHGGDLGVVADFWLEIVSLYMDLKLTRESDRFAAISGLARIIGSHFGRDGGQNTRLLGLENSPYIAGVWRHDLPRSLLWSRSAMLDKCWKSESIVPTWSWAAVRYNNKHNIGGISWEQCTSLDTDKQCRINSISCPIPGADNYTSFVGSRITIQAAMISAILLPTRLPSRRTSFNREKVEAPQGYILSMDGWGKRNATVDLSLDIKDDEVRFAFQKVKCILIACPRDDEIALVVRLVEGNLYERVGLSRHSKREAHFEGAAVIEIILI